MKTLFPILAVLLLVSCQKENSKTMAETLTTQQTQPLKAIPSYTVNGKVISLLANKSTGTLTTYGWQLEDSSPTYSPVTYSPSSSHKGADFVPIEATVQKTGTYTFRLTVYDKTSQDFALLNVEVK